MPTGFRPKPTSRISSRRFSARRRGYRSSGAHRRTSIASSPSIGRACGRIGSSSWTAPPPTCGAPRPARGRGRGRREGWEGFGGCAPAAGRRPSRRSQAPAARDGEGPPAIPPDSVAEAAGQSVVLFRPGMMTHLEQGNCLANARLIFSMWAGYLEYENSNPVLEWLDRHNIPLDQFHTAGHAAITELVELRRAFSAAPGGPIGRHPERFGVLFGMVQHRAVGEWWDVVRTP